MPVRRIAGGVGTDAVERIGATLGVAANCAPVPRLLTRIRDGKTVVHGHTPEARPSSKRWRIGIDTEAYASGALTALRLEGEHRDFIRIGIKPGLTAPTISDWEDIGETTSEPDVPDFEPIAPDPIRVATASSRPRRHPMMRVGAAAAAVLIVPAAGLAWKIASDGEMTQPFWVRPPAQSASGPAAQVDSDIGLRGPVIPDAPTSDAPPPAPATQAEPESVEVAAAPPASSGPRVQIAAVASDDMARKAGEGLLEALPGVTSGKTVETEAVTTAAGAKLYRSYIAGFADRAEAKTFCQKVETAGRGCMVRDREG